MKRLSGVIALLAAAAELFAADPKILDVDQYLAGKTADENNIVWSVPGGDSPFKLAGFYWTDPARQYNRLPWEPEQNIPTSVIWLGKHTSGGQIRFRTDSPRVLLRATLSNYGPMPHMPQTGSSGFDLYVGDNGKYSFVNSSAHAIGAAEFTKELFSSGNGKMHDFIINFPLYDGVEKVEIGLVGGSKMEPAAPFAAERPIVIYGTSITQGGCASRPGNLFTNILSRRLNREFLNYGFSGNGKGEPEMAELLSGIDDPALFILDYEANEDGKMAQTLSPFIDILRKHHPDMPILILPRIRFPEEAMYQDNKLTDERRGTVVNRWNLQKDEYDKRRAAGDEHIYFFDGGLLMGDDYADGMVDCWHPNDLGFYRMAVTLEPVIADILAKEGK